MSLNNKHRLTDLDLFAGEKTKLVIETLKKVISEPEHPHAYLFHGIKGSGKTTIVRILANKLNCEIQEINGASERGIDDMRAIKDDMNYLSMSGKNKAYIIDEVHKVTSDGQTSLLKPLEEPPKHVYFFLCTTEPQKVLSTIRSRCSTYKMESLTVPELRRFLTEVSRCEEKSFSRQLLEEIAIKAEGSPRDALTILEKVLNITDEEQQLAIVTNSFSDVAENVLTLCRQLTVKTSWKEIVTTLKSLDGEPEEIRRAVLGYVCACLMNSGESKFFQIADCFRENFYDEGKSGLILACYEAHKIIGG